MAAVVGMVTVAWYSFGGQISDEEMEAEARERQRIKREKKEGGRVRGVMKSLGMGGQGRKLA